MFLFLLPALPLARSLGAYLKISNYPEMVAMGQAANKHPRFTFDPEAYPKHSFLMTEARSPLMRFSHESERFFPNEVSFADRRGKLEKMFRRLAHEKS